MAEPGISDSGSAVRCGQVSAGPGVGSLPPPCLPRTHGWQAGPLGVSFPHHGLFERPQGLVVASSRAKDEKGQGRVNKAFPDPFWEVTRRPFCHVLLARRPLLVCVKRHHAGECRAEGRWSRLWGSTYYLMGSGSCL